MNVSSRWIALGGVLSALFWSDMACQPPDRKYTDGNDVSTGGGNPGQPCTSDEECIDELACNGVESCQDGACAPGTPIECQPPSNENCSAQCEEAAGGHECTVVAIDADGDGFGSAACEEAPGDDCDDEDATVNPGADEVCDGIDNDCNESIDFEDGLTLGGSPEMFVELDPADGYGADVAWTPNGERFGLVYVATDSSNRAIRLRLLNLDGSFAAVTTDLASTPLDSGLGLDEPSIHWGSDAFGLSWVERDGESDNTIRFATVQSNGSLNGPAVPAGIEEDARAPRVGRFGDGDWFVVWIAFDEDAFSVVGEVAVPPPPGPGPNAPVIIAGGSGPVSDPISIDVASLDDEFGAVVDTNNIGVSLTRYDTGLDALADGDYPESNNQAISATSDGYAAAWPTASGIAIQRRVATDPTANACSNENIDFGTMADPDDAVDIVATSDGMAVLATKPATDEIALFLFDNDCQLVQGPLSVSDGNSSSAVEPAMPRLAVGAAGYAAVWRASPTGAEHQGFRRTFGRNLCD